MMELFRIEVETQAAILNNGLVELEGKPEASMEIESLMRAAHSIKGAARIVALDAAVKIAHALEDCFVAAQSGQIILESQVIDVLFTGVDLLQRLAQIKGKDMENWLRECGREIETTIKGIAGILHPETSLLSSPQAAPTSLPVTPVTLLPYELQDNSFTIRELFAVEVETQAGILQNTLIVLKKNPDKPATTGELDSLKIAAHAIKGAAMLLDILPAVEIATTLEDCFTASGNNGFFTPEDINIFLKALDWLLEVARLDDNQKKNQSEQHKSGDIIIGQIKHILEQLSEAANNLGIEKGDLEEKTLPMDLPPGLHIVPNGGAPPSNPNTSPPSSSSSLAQRGGRGERSFAPREEKDEKIQRGSGLQPTYLPQLGGQTPPGHRVRSGQLSAAPTGAIQELSSPGGASADRVVRVSADNLNRLMGLAGESLVEAKWLQPFADSLLKLKKQNLELSNLLEKVRESVGEHHPTEGAISSINAARLLCNQSRELLGDRLQALEQFALDSANLSDRLYREVIATHMRPFADGVQGFPRLVRDLARELGKQVKLEITGHSTLVDRDILEKLEAPLNHLLRNAVDHGIEYPPERLAAGKPTTGTVLLEATHRAGMLLITVSDDGKGVEIEQLRQKIVQKNLVSPEMAHHLSETELMEFLFLPGFSTATKVTEISGRGVGLDVVHSTLAQVGGILRATSRPGQGMSFHLQLPLTLSVMRTLQVEISGEPYAFPLSRIDRILMVDRADVLVAENRQYFTFDDASASPSGGRNIGLIAASQVLELPPTQINSPQLPVVVISDRSATYGIVVDRFLGERDLVVRPLDPRLGKLQDISAAALMESGLPLLIIDVEDMVRSIDKVLSGGRLRKVSEPEQTHLTKSRKRVLIVDDSITVREVERKLLENNGYEVEVAVNGMDGWNAVRTNQYDLVITDVDMPRMNGIELVGQIKSHPHLKEIPVMIVSYKDRDEDRIRGLEAGADYYLTKSSFHDETLLHAVIDLIGT
uniref:histidine kinase n=1 Tax=Planktothricoides sp. SpSt-374 TaxID=2282167 RepID=A0A7C3ZJ67_9CYAN